MQSMSTLQGHLAGAALSVLESRNNLTGEEKLLFSSRSTAWSLVYLPYFDTGAYHEQLSNW